jgi:hypothetical protein
MKQSNPNIILYERPSGYSDASGNPIMDRVYVVDCSDDPKVQEFMKRKKRADYETRDADAPTLSGNLETDEDDMFDEDPAVEHQELNDFYEHLAEHKKNSYSLREDLGSFADESYKELITLEILSFPIRQ